MTVSTQATRIAYAGDGSSTAFAVPFPFFDATDLEVIERQTATGVETPRMLGADYAVTGGNGATGTVSAVVAPAVGTEWVIRRRTGRVQGADYVPHDPFPSESHERGLDRLTLIAQELDEETGRALKLPKGESGTATIPALPARAGRLLGFDADGAPIAVAGTAPNVLVSEFAETLLDDADAAAARATLGAGAAGDAVFQAPSTIAAHDATHANGDDIASAATLDLDAATGDQVDVTGTTTITAITLAPGRLRTVRFTGALTLTHGANLVLPGAANIVTAAGDVAVFRGYAGGVVRCVHYQRASLVTIAATPTELQAGAATNRVLVPWSTGRGWSLGNVLGESSLIAINHNLGIRPRFLSFFLRCISPEQSFSIGDEVEFCMQSGGSSGTDANTTVEVTTTEIKLYLGGAGSATWQPVLVNKSTSTYFAIDISKWVLDVYWSV